MIVHTLIQGESLQQCWCIGGDGGFFCNPPNKLCFQSTYTRCSKHPQLVFVQVNFYQVFVLCFNEVKFLTGCAVQKELKISGERLLSKEGLDWAGCAVACFHHPDCYYWTHQHHLDNPEKQTCELSSSDEQKVPAQPSSMTGQKACGGHGAEFLTSTNIFSQTKNTSAQTNQAARVWPKAKEKYTPEHRATDQNTTGIRG